MPLTAQVTLPGSIVGTLAYMAPEQFRGEAADTATDQFSFAVALHEALYGHRPFAGDTLAEVVAAMNEGRVREAPKNTRVPPWVRAVILRGLAQSRADRFESMAAMLAALERDPSAARRRRLVWGAGTAAAFAHAGIAYMARPRQSPAQLCEPAPEALAGVWSGDVRRSIHDAFRASGAPRAEETFGRVAPMLDAYAAKWASADVDACREKLDNAKESAAGFRMACLDRKRTSMRALTALFAKADEQVVGRAVDAVYGLTGPDECRDTNLLRSAVGLPDDPRERIGVIAVRKQIADANSLYLAGKWEEARTLAQRAVEAARAIPHEASEAEALALVELATERFGDYPGAVEAARLAFAAAERAGNDARRHVLVEARLRARRQARSVR